MRLVVAVVAAMVSWPILAAAEPAQMLLYEADEAGLDSYSSRVLVTKRYLRMDDGDGAEGFVLYDRSNRVIHNVVHGDQSVMEIRASAVSVEPPVPLNLSERQLPVAEGTRELAGKRLVHHQLLSGSRVCYDVVVAPGLLQDAVQALGEFRTVLAGEYAAALGFVPAEMHDPCDLAIHTFKPTWLLEHGLPVQEWDDQGGGQRLLDYQSTFDADNSLFELPRNYSRFSLR